MKKYEFYFWFRYGDYKDHDTKEIEAKDEAEAWEKFNMWVDKEAARSIRTGLQRKTIELKEL